MTLLRRPVVAERREARRPDGTAVPDVLNIWVRHPIDARWMAALRLVRSGGRFRVGEARLFPIEPDADGRAGGDWSGCWRGADADAPRRGLTKQVLARAQPHRWREFIEEHLPQLRQAVPELFPVLRGPRAEPSGRGRHPHADAFLAQVASTYAKAVVAGQPPVEAVARQHGQPVAKVRGWVHQARLRGFLSKVSHQGVTGGVLTPEATFILDARKPKPRPKTTTCRRTRRRPMRRKS